MADPKIRIRRSATPNKVPSTTQLLLGELAINTYDGKVYLEQDQGGVGVGTTVVAINPWGVGIGSTAFNTQFTAGKVGIATTNPQYNLDVGGNVNFTGSLYQDGSLFTSGSTGVGLATAGGIVGYAATVIDFRGPGVTTAYYSSATGIGTVYFHSVTSGGGGGGASVTVSDSAPGSPSNGDLWFKSDVGELYVYYTDGSSNQWVEASGGSNTVVTSDTPPTSPQDGDLWWNSNTGELKIYYNDGNSSQWVDANSEGGFVQYWTQTNTNGTLGVTTTSYVGIGTTTATDALTVSGNANVTGFLTATQLNGAVSSTGVNVSGVATALNLIAPVTSSGVNVTGVATALQLKGPLTSSGINVTGVSTFSNTVDINSNLDVSGNATIGGVLTYEDVRNVDSIGIVTARTGIKVLAGGANIVDGTTTDELNVTGVATAVQLNATTTNVSGVSTFAGNIDANGDLDVDGIANLDDVSIAGVSTFAGNIDANGDLDVDGHTELDNVNVIGIATIQQVKATTLNVTGVSTVTGGVKVGTAATICSEGNMTIDRPSAGIITATKFIGDGSDLTGVISGIGIGTESGVVGYAATIVHFRGAGVTTAYYNAATGIGTVFFHSAGGGGGNTNVTIQDTPPSSPSAGDLWWESDIGELKIYYNDGNSSAWVDASGADSLVQIGTSAPTGPVSGDLWFNSETADFMVYYTDANSSAWVSLNAVNSERIWSTNSTGIHTTRSVGIGTTTVTDALTVVGATDLDGRLLVSGITTFGSHVYHGDSDRAIFGDGSDLQMYHLGGGGGASYIEDSSSGGFRIRTSGGELLLDGNNTTIRSGDGGETQAKFTDNGSVDLYWDNSKKFSTTAGGAKVWGTVGSANTALVVVGDARVTGIITVGTGSLKITDRDINMVGVITGANFKSGTTNVHNVGVEAAGINVLGADTPIGTGATVYNSGLIVSKKGAEFQGVVTASSFTGNITNPSNDITTRNLKVTGIGTFNGDLNVLGTLTYEDVKNVDSAGIATARQGLRITGGGLDVVGVSTFNDNILLLDNDQVKFGTGGDLKVYHTGSHSYIDNTSTGGHLYLRQYSTSSNKSIILGGASSHKFAEFVHQGGVDLYHNNSKKLETTSTGVNITGASSRITGSGQSRLMIGSTNAGGAAIYFDGDSNGDLAGGDYSWILHNTSGDMEYVVDNPAAAGNHIFKTGGSSEKLRITSAGFVGINQTAPAVELDIKATSPEIRLTCSDNNLDQGDTIGQLGWYTTDPTTPGGAGTVSYINTFSANGNGADYSTKIFNRDGSGGGSTQIQLGNALGSITFGTNTAGNASTERLRITSMGDLYAGNGAGYAIWNNSTIRPRFQFKQTTGDNRGFALLEERGDGNCIDLYISKSRGGNGAGVITSGDSLGTIQFTGADGTNQVTGASINAWTSGTVAADRIPTNLSIYTHPDSTAGKQERVRITSAGLVGINCDPDSALEIRSTVNSYTPVLKISNHNTGAYGGAIKFESYHSSTAYQTAAIYGYGGSGNSDGILSFHTRTTERMRIDKDGRVCWSMTGNAGSPGATTLSHCIVNNGNAGGAYPGIHIKSLDGGGGNGIGIFTTDDNFDLYTRAGNKHGMALSGNSTAASSGETSIYIGNDHKVTLGPSLSASLSTSRVCNTALHVVNGGVSIGCKGDSGGTHWSLGGRYVLGWYAKHNANSTYYHIKTDLWGGGSPHGNSEYIMGGFIIHGYGYSQGVSEQRHFFHNWGGSFHGRYTYNNTSGWNPGVTTYVSSDGFVVLRLAGGTYISYVIDLIQMSNYDVRDIIVSGTSNSNSSTAY